MATREIVTLQFGHYSNFIGAHFWNIQEQSFDYTGTVKTECNHDILYREGQTNNNEVTYTPRLLLADIKGSLRTLPASGGLSEDVNFDPESWDNVEKIEEPGCSKNQYLLDVDTDANAVNTKQYNFEDDVKSWTDFLYPRFNARTINIVKDYQHGNETESFDTCCSGRNIWKSDYGETFVENIRRYVEECDSMQGFHVNFDCTDGFAGLALGCIEHLADEYSKTILAHPIIASHFPDNDPKTQKERDISNLKDSIRLANVALSIQELSQHATFFVPLCTGEKGWRQPGNPRIFDYIQYDPKLYYHSSSILAAALDTLSQKYRHKSSVHTLSDICADMAGYGRKMGAASLRLPFTMNESEYLIDHLNNTTVPIYKSITPSCKIGTDKIFQIITVRGVPEGYLKAPVNDKQAHQQKNLPAYRCTTVKEMFELYFQASNFLSATNVTISEKPLDVKTPFPKFFSTQLCQYGFIKKDDRDESACTVPVLSGYHNGNFMTDMLEKMHREACRIKFSKLNRFSQEGLESAEWKESLDLLAEFKDNYEDNFEL